MGRYTLLIAANDNLPTEEWRSVPSMEGVEASSHGRVRRLPYVGVMPHGFPRVYAPSPTFGTIRSASKDARHLFFGYYYAGIGNLKVHFAVCEAFHGPAPEGKRRVRHLNENGLDNRPCNLVWDRQKVNMNDPTLKGYQRRRVYPKSGSILTKVEKRAGVYDNIIDFARRHGDRIRAIADNDNQALADVEKFVRMNEQRLSRERELSRAQLPQQTRCATERTGIAGQEQRTFFSDNVDRDQDILRRHESGERHTAIAKDHGISRERVRQVVLLLGGSPRRKKD